jgi:hypothetical protein
MHNVKLNFFLQYTVYLLVGGGGSEGCYLGGFLLKMLYYTEDLSYVQYLIATTQRRVLSVSLRLQRRGSNRESSVACGMQMR